MGGQVLDYEAKRIHDEGIKVGEAIGEARGEAKGEARGLVKGLYPLAKEGILTMEQVVKQSGLSEDEILKVAAELKL